MSILVSQRIARYHDDLRGALEAVNEVALRDPAFATNPSVRATVDVLMLMIQAIERDNGHIRETMDDDRMRRVIPDER